MLLWKKSELLQNAVRSKVSRFLADDTGDGTSFDLKEGVTISALSTASLCGSKELLAVFALAGSEEVTGSREEERMERNVLLY